MTNPPTQLSGYM